MPSAGDGPGGILSRVTRFLFGAGKTGGRLSRSWRPIQLVFGLSLFACIVSIGILAFSLDKPLQCAATLCVRSSDASGASWTLFGLGLGYLLATTIFGVFVGFLFGLPRLGAPRPPQPHGPSGSASEDTESVSTTLLRSNSNLERISDWLTSAIVALALVNLQNAYTALQRVRASAGEMFCGARGACPTGLVNVSIQVVVVFGLTWGFLLGYLQTRIFIAILLRDAEKELQDRDSQYDEIGDLGKIASEAVEKAAVGEDPALSSSERTQLEEIANRDTASQTDPRLLALMAEARLVFGRNKSAIEAATRAKQVSGGNQVIAERADAVVSRATERSVNAVNFSMFKALEERPPNGFARAIDLGRKTIEQGPPDQPQFWVNLACAYGQQHAWAGKQQPPDATAMANAADSALAAAKKAIELGPSWRQRLRQLWDPSDKDKAPEDNDLESLFPDKRFKDLLLRPRNAS